jgi:hypothetical protein
MSETILSPMPAPNRPGWLAHYRLLTQRWMLTLTLVVVARLLLALFSPSNFDLDSYRIVANLVQNGTNVYAATTRYNYSPVWFHVLGLLSVFGTAYVGSAARVLLTLVDVANGYLLGKLATRPGTDNYREIMLLYLINPGVVAITSFHGQFEALALLPFLFALTLDKQRNGVLLAPVLMGLAVLVKHNVAPLVWVFLLYRYGFDWGVQGMIAIGLVFAGSFLPYMRAIGDIWRNVVAYVGGAMTSGLSWIIGGNLAVVALVVVSLTLPFLLRWFRLSMLRSLALAALLVALCYPRFAPQYFLPLLLLWTPFRDARVWVFGLGAIMVINYPMPFDTHRLFTLIVWLFCYTWLIVYILRYREARREAHEQATA